MGKTLTLNYDRSWLHFGDSNGPIAVNIGWTCPANEYITKFDFINIGTKPTGYNNYCAWILSVGGTSTSVWTLWACNAAKTLWVELGPITLNPASGGVANDIKTKTFPCNGRKLAGQAIHLYIEKPAGSSLNPQNFQLRGYNKLVITTASLGTKPSVKAGDIITKAQMDALRTWNTGAYVGSTIVSPQEVAQNDYIKESVADTYYNADKNSIVQASWYNNQV